MTQPCYKFKPDKKKYYGDCKKCSNCPFCRANKLGKKTIGIRIGCILRRENISIDELHYELKEYFRNSLKQEVPYKIKSLYNYRNGKASPSIESLAAFMKIFNTSEEFLLGITNDRYKTPNQKIVKPSIEETEELINTQTSDKGISLELTKEEAEIVHRMSAKLKSVESGYPEKPLERASNVTVSYDTSEYIVINGRIHLSNNVVDFENELNKISIYDLIDNAINNDALDVYEKYKELSYINVLKKAYSTKRFTMGVLGALDADDYLMVCYLLGRHERLNKR